MSARAGACSIPGPPSLRNITPERSSLFFVEKIGLPSVPPSPSLGDTIVWTLELVTYKNEGGRAGPSVWIGVCDKTEVEHKGPRSIRSLLTS